MVTTTEINSAVPPKLNGTLANICIKFGNKHTRVMYTAPNIVSLVITPSIYFAVCSPGRIPGIKALERFKFSATSRGLKTNAV